jgi:hypothetical protein
MVSAEPDFDGGGGRAGNQGVGVIARCTHAPLVAPGPHDDVTNALETAAREFPAGGALWTFRLIVSMRITLPARRTRVSTGRAATARPVPELSMRIFSNAVLPYTTQLRAARERSRLASSSPTNSSFTGSIVSLRLRIQAIAAAWQAIWERRITSGLAAV